jgi:hypothetical protein
VEDAEAKLSARIRELREVVDAPYDQGPQLRAFKEWVAARGTPGAEELRERFEESSRDLRRLQKELKEAELQLAQTRGDPYFVELRVDRADLLEGATSGSVWLRPDLSGSGELFLQSEFGHPAVAFFGTLWTADDRPEDVGQVMITFTMASPMTWWGVSQAKFGYPNEEAFTGNRLMGPGFSGIGFYEVLNSRWAGEIVAFNRPKFPDTPDNLGLRHFVLACKENTLEVLAGDFTVERLDKGLEAALRRYFQRPT